MSRSEHALTAVIVAVFVGLAALWLWQFTRENRSVRSLPPETRTALYARTLETLKATCTVSRGAELGEFCTQQADFILHFEECDSACRELARGIARPASR